MQNLDLVSCANCGVQFFLNNTPVEDEEVLCDKCALRERMPF